MRAWFLLLLSGTAHAWETHQLLMYPVVSRLSPEATVFLMKEYDTPCPPQDLEKYRKIAEELNLKIDNPIAPTDPGACSNPVFIDKTSPREVLQGAAADDPDNGMDRDLPDSADPRGDRRTMGGTKGPTSQGFRHMYFGGWRFSRPLTTFQVPPRSQGQAPERAQIIADYAKKMIKDGDLLWGYRVLGWAMHYLQDLAQPFHAVQLPSLRMVPWSALLAWPPGKAFDGLITETTRTISNYHWAYEGYVKARIKQSEKPPYTDCLFNSEKHSPIQVDLKEKNFPGALAHAVVEDSVEIAAEMGRSEVAFIGGELKGPDYDLANGKGTLDYAGLSSKPELASQRDRLDRVTCRALANAVRASRLLVQWSLEP